jgi:predicted DNA-binding transcriptional regulator AlpA
MISDQKRISPPEAAKYIGMSESWLSKSRMTGMDAPRHIKIGRRVVYDTADLDAWLAAHQRMNTSQPLPAFAGAS